MLENVSCLSKVARAQSYRKKFPVRKQVHCQVETWHEIKSGMKVEHLKHAKWLLSTGFWHDYAHLLDRPGAWASPFLNHPSSLAYR